LEESDGTMATNGAILQIIPEKLLQPSLFDSGGSTNSVITYKFAEKDHSTTFYRYLNSMKTEASLERNIDRVLKHLLGEKTERIRLLPAGLGNP
jgi:hypothetical protein